mgnify:CR=1 FL=1
MLGPSKNVARLFLARQGKTESCAVCGEGTKFLCSCGQPVHPRHARTGEHSLHVQNALQLSRHKSQ